MSKIPTATITIGTATDRAKYEGAGVLHVAADAALPPAPRLHLCTLPAGTVVEHELSNGFRLRTPDGVLFDLRIHGLPPRFEANG